MTWKLLSSHREHGGDIDVARQRFGRADMIDLSTGISPRSYPAPTLTAKRLQALAMTKGLPRNTLARNLENSVLQATFSKDWA